LLQVILIAEMVYQSKHDEKDNFELQWLFCDNLILFLTWQLPTSQWAHYI